MEEEKEIQKKSSKSLFILIPIVLIFLAVIGFILFNVYTVFNNTSQSTALASEMQKLYTAMSNGTEIDMNIYTKGEIGKLEKYFKDNSSALITATKNYTAIDERMVLLSGSALKNDMDLSLHKQAISDLRVASNEMYDAALLFSNLDNLKSQVDLLKISEKQKNSIISELETDFSKYYDSAAKAKEIQSKILDKYEEAVNLLANNKKDWSINGDFPSIPSETLLNSYNKITLERNALEKELQDCFK